MPRLTVSVLAIAALAAGPVLADSFRTISDRDTFVSVVKDRTLQIPLFGIDLRVFEAGQIAGRALGREVRGNWQWSEDGYFCRSLFWGEENVGDNCQLVEVNGKTVRFTSDRGSGRHADLHLR